MDEVPVSKKKLIPTAAIGSDEAFRYRFSSSSKRLMQ